MGGDEDRKDAQEEMHPVEAAEEQTLAERKSAASPPAEPSEAGSSDAVRWGPKTIATVFAVLGAVGGALLKFVVDDWLDRTKADRQARSSAYVSFVERDRAGDAASAERARIAIYGGREVAEAMAEYYRTVNSPGRLHLCHESSSTSARDAEIYHRMRAEFRSGEKEALSHRDMLMLLFTCCYEEEERGACADPMPPDKQKPSPSEDPGDDTPAASLGASTGPASPGPREGLQAPNEGAARQ